MKTILKPEKWTWKGDLNVSSSHTRRRRRDAIEGNRRKRIDKCWN